MQFSPCLFACQGVLSDFATVTWPFVGECQARHGEELERWDQSADEATPIAMQSPKLIEILRIVLIGAWLILLIPWLYFAPASFMAFDSGDSLHARLFVLSVCTYPIAVVIALLLRNAKPWLLLLPCINLVGWFISGSYT